MMSFTKQLCSSQDLALHYVFCSTGRTSGCSCAMYTNTHLQVITSSVLRSVDVVPQQAQHQRAWKGIGRKSSYKSQQHATVRVVSRYLNLQR